MNKFFKNKGMLISWIIIVFCLVLCAGLICADFFNQENVDTIGEGVVEKQEDDNKNASKEDDKNTSSTHDGGVSDSNSESDTGRGQVEPQQNASGQSSSNSDKKPESQKPSGTQNQPTVKPNKPNKPSDSQNNNTQKPGVQDEGDNQGSELPHHEVTPNPPKPQEEKPQEEKPQLPSELPETNLEVPKEDVEGQSMGPIV